MESGIAILSITGRKVFGKLGKSFWGRGKFRVVTESFRELRERFLEFSNKLFGCANVLVNLRKNYFIR